MGVLVCYDDFTYDVINDYHLEYLLAKGCIVGFDKSDDWVKKEENSQTPEAPAKQAPRGSTTAKQLKRYLQRK